MKQCEWCDRTMKRQNYRRHQSKCFYKTEICLKRSELLLLKSNKPKEIISEETKNLEIAFMELKHYLTDSYHKTFSLYNRIIASDQRDAIVRLKEMHVSDVTKDIYLREWKLYKKFIDKKKLSPGKDSANTYLSNLNCRASTLRRKQCMIQNILRFLVDCSIKLNRVSTRISFVPKYALSDKEINDYLNEQRSKNHEDYLIQRLLITYGLRINSMSSMKRKHLVFLNNNEMKILIPDSKVKKERYEDIDQDLAKQLSKFVRNDLANEDYVFLRTYNIESAQRRAQVLCNRINKRIKKSRVLNKNPNFKYSSHMFRKTKAYNLFQKGLVKLKAKARLSIGQSQNSQAIESYIN